METAVPPSTPLTNTIKIGHTPDADDAFMFFGFAQGKVAIANREIEHVVEDIQKLNQMALKAELDMTAISAAIYPFVQADYWILPIGASVGRNYGPTIVKRAGEKPTTKTIGVPGRYTTATLLLKLLTTGFVPLEYRFDLIPEALKNREIDYGLFIHEAQITYSELGFDKVLDLGEEWMKETNLPIPLGLDVIKKSLGEEAAISIGKSFQDSIRAAQQNSEAAVEYALQYGRGMDKFLGRKFIEMYVNADTLQMGEDSEKALSVLFDKGYRAGIFPKPTRVDVLRF